MASPRHPSDKIMARTVTSGSAASPTCPHREQLTTGGRMCRSARIWCSMVSNAQLARQTAGRLATEPGGSRASLETTFFEGHQQAFRLHSNPSPGTFRCATFGQLARNAGGLLPPRRLREHQGIHFHGMSVIGASDVTGTCPIGGRLASVARLSAESWIHCKVRGFRWRYGCERGAEMVHTRAETSFTPLALV